MTSRSNFLKHMVLICGFNKDTNTQTSAEDSLAFVLSHDDIILYEERLYFSSPVLKVKYQVFITLLYCLEYKVEGRVASTF